MTAIQAFRAIRNDGWKPGEFPDRIKVMDWGANENIFKYPVIVNDYTAEVFAQNQKNLGRAEVALDYNHCTCKESPEYQVHGDKPSIFAYGTPRVVPGDGIWLENLRWTDYGRQYAKNVADISPVPVTNKKSGEVLALDSVALTPTGAIDDLHFYSAYASTQKLHCHDASELDGGNVDDDDFGMAHHEPDGNEANQVVEAHEFDADDHYSKYGDVSYADAENHKYPVDSEKHVKAAWSYINMPKNAAKYAPSKVASIKSKIRSKFKQYGIAETETKTHSYTAPRVTPGAYATVDKYDSTTDEIMDHVKHFRAILGSDADGKTDDEVMDIATKHLEATWSPPSKKKAPLDNPRSGIEPVERGGDGEPETDDIESKEHGGVTISYASVRKLIDAQVQPLKAEIDGFKAKELAMSEASEQAEKDRLIAQATQDGKVVPLKAETVKITPLSALRELIGGLAPSVPVSPITRPLSANAEGKLVARGAGRSQCIEAWNDAARSAHMNRN